ncbi:M56 family metallopeptidase [Chitinophaga horti]|uniref:M56 family metallopeptidase n=1 Tax=Chitinophaga horti TaxID=2920382 RepID=A0ABY6IW15_9BACT|nr:M56 family metallopeptidase [Chitinophaga horti]UYQ91568.1 M56 family metallopeptidase [Chitinophaga horti]
MTPFIAYLLKVIVCSGVLYGYYYVALRNNKFHQWNRYYLLFSTLLSLVIPLLKIPLPMLAAESDSTVYTYTSQLVTFRETVLPATKEVDYFQWSSFAYLLVIMVLLARIAYSCMKIFSIVRNNPVQYVKPYWFVVSEKVMSPFSFFRYIFWNRETSLESPEGQQILQHELAHLTERHSVDKLLLEIITALCWVNPFFHLAKRELALIHEFIADKKAAANGEVAAYARTILQMALGNTQFTLTNNFFHPPIKRRIIMLTQSKQPKFSYLRRVMILPLGAVIFASLSFVIDPTDIADLKAALTPTTTPAATPAPAPAEMPVEPAFSSTAVVIAPVEAVAAPTFRLEGVVTSKSGTPVKNATILIKGTQNGTISDADGSFALDELPEQATIVVSSVGFVTREVAINQGGRNLLIQLERDNKEMKEVVVVAYGDPADEATPAPQEPVRKNKEVFTYVEQAPAFVGGDAELMKYLSRNIRYPQAALKANIEGTVYISFVVDDEGNITDANTVGKARGGGLEEEALRVTKAMPKWKPGKQNGQNVSVRFALPIRFTIDKGSKKQAPPPPPSAKKETSRMKSPDMEGVFTFVETPPNFPGGIKELEKYLSKNVRYPHKATENGQQGTVFVTFVVNKDGSLSDVAIVGARKGYGLDEEAIRVVKTMPNWTPGEEDGKKVKVQYNLPIRFTLQS